MILILKRKIYSRTTVKLKTREYSIHLKFFYLSSKIILRFPSADQNLIFYIMEKTQLY